MAEPSRHIQSLVQGDLLNWVHTQRSTEEMEHKPRAGCEGGAEKTTVDESDVRVRNLGAWGGGERRLESSKRAGPSVNPRKSVPPLHKLKMNRSLGEPQKEPATSPQARQLVIFIQNQSHVWACYEENLPNFSQLGGVNLIILRRSGKGQ